MCYRLLNNSGGANRVGSVRKHLGQRGSGMIGRKSDTTKTEENVEPKGFDDFELRLGDIMRGERATMGKSLLDVQRELRIKASYIAAIEACDPDAFDTPGFIAGYVRSYARYLNMDPEWAFKTFCEEGNFEVAHGMSPAARIRSDRAPGVKKSAAASAKPAHLRDPFTDPSVSYLPKGEAALSRVEPRAIGSIMVLLVLIRNPSPATHPTNAWAFPESGERS